MDEREHAAWTALLFRLLDLFDDDVLGERRAVLTFGAFHDAFERWGRD